eukprot:CAMPEP_0204184790 /NCGR_PEP_ID=MMETSP0361-20130328/54731_1 /ASSEMBLY_ACC=CAM_ASM_000343 /TAXON_ID=268821 /ORGANISM="Scrippsiella Hangoei, Strain SHTV-5" /LENGTH=391 /DNA_ID=CAMNT_0051144869 /DNA_START=139 /DNA_END=1314 /DNA_ORIENTATION=-
MTEPQLPKLPETTQPAKMQKTWYCPWLAECYNRCYLTKAVGPCKAQSCCPSSAAYYYDDASLGYYVCNGTDNACMVACTREHEPSCRENLQVERPSRCKRVEMLRIQKTGSTTLGETVLPHLCEMHGQHCGKEDGFTHLEFNGAIALANKGVPEGTGCVFTMLRDVLERTLSEFFFLRENLWALNQDQWDVQDSEVGKLIDIITQADTSKAFQEYLHSEANPARNRQTLYLLGFERRLCKPGCELFVSTDFSNGVPALAYNWSAKHDELLAQAKAHLMELTAFGLADCLRLSIEVMAPRLGWDGRVAAGLLQTQSRSQDKAAYKDALHGLKPSQDFALKHGSARRMSRWRSGIDPVLAEEILAVNRLDADLVEFARATFRDLYKRDCVATS